MTDAPHDGSEGYIIPGSDRGMPSRHQFIETPSLIPQNQCLVSLRWKEYKFPALRGFIVAFLSHMMHAGGGLPKGMTDRITVFLSFSTYPVDYHLVLISIFEDIFML